VKYAPRKVYIKDSGGYVDKLFIPVQGCLLEVVREQYTDFYRGKETWCYLNKLDTKNSLLSKISFYRFKG